MATDRVASSNLSLILERLHRGGQASRAELTRETGLNRSTIAALVSELADRGIVEEHEPVATNLVGRPSPIVGVCDKIVAVAVVPLEPGDVVLVKASRAAGLDRLAAALLAAPDTAEPESVA